MKVSSILKKASVFALIVGGIFSQSVLAQAPQGLNYQAIARSASGAIIQSHAVGLRLTITDISGTTVYYEETQSATTNQFGLFTITVGGGTVVSGTFSAISWGTITPYLKVEMDPTGGVTYAYMGTSQLLSVPYALYAASGNQGPAGTNGTNGTNGTDGTNGTNGINGTNGTNGSTWYTGSGAPPGGLGVVNDLYLDTATGNYYQKTGASIWTLEGTLASNAGISGTTNYLTKFASATTLGNSVAYDNGSFIGIGTTTPGHLLDVIGSSASSVGASSNTNATGTGFAAANTAASGVNTGNGLYGSTSQSNGVGVYGANFNSGGTGVLGIGNNVLTFTFPIGGAGGAFYGNGIGLYGYTNAANEGFGVYGKSTSATSAYGVVGSANGVLGAAPSTGTGGAFFAYDYGVSGVTTDQNYTGGTQMAGGYFGLGYNGTSLASLTLVEAVNGVTGTHYKIWGSPVGTVATTVPDLNGNQVTLHAPETPEFYFQDYGQATLVNGKAHIDIDPILAANVKISEKHPLRVFVQLEGDCKGVYVTNKTATGFDVVELEGGTSNVSFQWSITCNVADAKLGKGISPFADLRFEPGPVQDIKNLSSKDENKTLK